jgi:hypothetical protein
MATLGVNGIKRPLTRLLFCRFLKFFYRIPAVKTAKNLIILNFVQFLATKKVKRTNFFLPPPLLMLLDPGWIIIRTQAKHPGSATHWVN